MKTARTLSTEALMKLTQAPTAPREKGRSEGFTPTRRYLMQRPETFECPWCGPNGVAVDWTLPEALRICDACQDPRPMLGPAYDPRAASRYERRTSLEAILRRHLTEFHTPWPGAEHGKTILGNALCDALRDAGGDPESVIRERCAELDGPAGPR